MIPPRYIILSGGGIKVISIVGALKALEEKGQLKNVKEISGVSAGAWLAFMISAGLPILIMEELISGLDFSIIRNLKPELLLGFPETFGLDDGSNLVKFLESLFRVVLKIDPFITFSEFNKLNLSKIQFRCWATDLKEHTTCEFSLEKTPNAKILDALRGSMSLPLYFTPVLHPITGNMLSDGGIQGNLPLHLLSERQHDSCIGIGFATSNTEKKNPEDIMNFMSSIFSCLIHSRHENLLKKLESRIIRIPLHNTASWDFELSRERRIELIKCGYTAGLSWFTKKQLRLITRRHSLQ
jgi:NTE family protein